MSKLTLDDFFQNTPLGSIKRASGNNLSGINHQQTATFLQTDRDSYGLTFFVRPQLNLQDNNIRNVRKLYPLLNKNNLSIQRYTRCALDPRLMVGYGTGRYAVPPIISTLLDNTNAFFTVLTNNLVSLTGWPSSTLSVYDSEAGLYKEVYSQVNGVAENYTAYDLDATFKNVKGSPTLYILTVWYLYQAYVYTGKVVPYYDMIKENEIDYMTRIYRITLDQDKRHIKKIGSTGVSFPISIPDGAFFDFNSETPYSSQVDDFTVRFHSLGTVYNDDIAAYEFNATVSIFNPSMLDENRSSSMVEIPIPLLNIFNNRGYPFIDMNDKCLKWFISKDKFRRITKTYIEANLLDPNEVKRLAKNVGYVY